jgi:fatty acid desaturase
MIVMTDTHDKNHDTGPDYRKVLRSLSADEKRAVTTLTDRHGLMHLTAHLALIGALAWVNASQSGIIGFGGMLGQGIAMCFLFCAMHEAGHGTAFKTKPINVLVANAAGYILFTGPLWFKSFHAAHHRHTHDPAHDPELATAKPRTLARYLFHISGVMIWWNAVKTLVLNAWRRPEDEYIPASTRKQVTHEARKMIAFYLVVIGGGIIAAPEIIVTFWLIPIVLGQPFLRLFLLAEHAGCPEDPDMLKNSRTTRTNPGVLFLSWNMPYHTAHHSFPAVPFHQLPAFHRYMEAYVRNECRGYYRFHHDFVSKLPAPEGDVKVT